ncbi:multidrug effflux MFS transporter [Francisellaceae bacterium]|nr:multidrug effflux MFS transporter [Francisellaceae bacterium]
MHLVENGIVTEEAQKKPAMLTLIVLISLASIGSVLPTPALTDMAKSYGVLAYQTEWVISIFVFGYAISQIFYGPISNSIGRKNALYLGITVSLVGGLLCVFSNSLSSMLFGRFIMALGAGCGLNMTFTIINDYYEPKEARKVIAYASSAFAILPGLAIFMGGLLTSYLNWRSCFVFLALFNLGALVLVKLLPETHHKNNRVKLSAKNIISQYYKAFSNSRIYVYTGLWGVSTAIIYTVSATASIIAVKKFGLSPANFSIMFLVVMVFYFCGNIITAKLGNHLTPRKLIKLGAFVSSIGAIILVVLNQYSVPNMYYFFIPLALVYLGLPLIFATASAQAMQQAEDKSTTSSIVSFMIMMIAFVSSSSVSGIDVGLYHDLPLIILLFVLIINVLVIFEKRVQTSA